MFEAAGAILIAIGAVGLFSYLIGVIIGNRSDVLANIVLATAIWLLILVIFALSQGLSM